jgi:flagellar biosynthetic protein FliR
MMVFLILDGHHQVFRALAASFDVIPLTGAALAGPGNLMLTWTGELFVTAIRLASPFMITIFLVDMSLGIFARVAPQTEVFSMSLSLKLLVGILLSYIYIQNFFPVIPGMLTRMSQDLLDMIEVLMPR